MTSNADRTIMLLLEGGSAAGHRGGTEGWSGYIRYWESAVKSLQKLGYGIIYTTIHGEGPLHPVMRSIGCPAHALDCRSAKEYPRAVIKLMRLLRSTHSDILHCNEAIAAAIGGTAARSSLSTGALFHRHHVASEGKQLIMTRYAERVCEQTMAVSEAVAARSAAEGTARTRICLAYNGIPAPERSSPEEAMQLRESLDIPPKAPVVVTVGHLRPEKGHMTLLEALPLVHTAVRKRPHVVFVGSGPEYTRLRNRAEADHLPIHLVGHQERVMPWYEMADVVAVPSHEDSFGLVAVEAMAAGCPVVATTAGGLPEVVLDGVTGLLAHPGDPQSLGEAVARLLMFPNEAGDLGQAGEVRYRDLFTVEAMVRGWSDCYTRMLCSSARRDGKK